MPELPEVETLRRGLERLLVGSTIEAVHVSVPKMMRGGMASPEEFCGILNGCRIESVARRGKHLIIALDSGYYLLLHLKMRGQLFVMPRESEVEKYLALTVELDGGRDLRFHDMWRWGEFSLLSATELAALPSLRAMGVEPLSEEFTPDVLGRALARRAKTTIKAALLDQTVVAGIGNIYADESLFRSGILPLRMAGNLMPAEIERLYTEILKVLLEATGDGGTASDNFFDTEGAAGRYIPRVYDRGGAPCLSCGTILVRTRITGRGTVYCPVCQS